MAASLERSSTQAGPTADVPDCTLQPAAKELLRSMPSLVTSAMPLAPRTAVQPDRCS